MKWLQWSYLDTQNGLGGVETHMRSLARELSHLGVEAALSSDPDDLLSGKWDVIHTHGSSLEILLELRGRFAQRKGSHIWAHTLHGMTHERMIACKEFVWPGGYLAILREIVGSLNADILFAIHPKISLFNLLQMTNKKCVVSGNGWDPWTESDLEKSDALPTQIETKLKELKNFWIFIGRGQDRVKGLERLFPALELMPELKLVGIPGEGFEQMKNVFGTGILSPLQIRAVLSMARGLILTSRFEGLPLVVLEALAEGVPVVSSLAGGLRTLSPELNGFFRLHDPSPQNIARAVKEAEQLPSDQESRLRRAQHNRRYLKTWKDVAQTVLTSVNEVLAKRH